MDGQPPAVEIIGLVAEKIEKLAIHQGGHKVKGAVVKPTDSFEVYEIDVNE